MEKKKKSTRELKPTFTFFFLFFNLFDLFCILRFYFFYNKSGGGGEGMNLYKFIEKEASQWICLELGWFKNSQKNPLPPFYTEQKKNK